MYLLVPADGRGIYVLCCSMWRSSAVGTLVPQRVVGTNCSHWAVSVSRLQLSTSPTPSNRAAAAILSSDKQLLIGLEIHAQLLAKHKLFSAANVSFAAHPNACASYFDAALPGTLPKLNEECVRLAIRTGLALKGTIKEKSIFSRKHYFYCDLPLGYQITQQEYPIVEGGSLEGVRIHRIQLEQDSGKNLHDVNPDYTFVDLNRAGSALLEIVTHPDMTSPEHACLFISKLQNLLQHIDACGGIMAEGSLRCDVNVSVHKKLADGKLGQGERVEVKNLNSLRAVAKAITYEAQRQADCLDRGVSVERETRAWDARNGTTFKLRSKEDLLDYRFMLDPDLPPLHISEDLVEQVRSNLPELPADMIERFMKQYSLQEQEAVVLVEEQPSVKFYEELVAIVKERCDGVNIPRVCWNWLVNDLFGRLRAAELTFKNSPVSPKKLADVVELVINSKVSGKIGKEILELLVRNDSRTVMEIVTTNDWLQISDETILLPVCQEVFEAHPDEVKRYLGGKERHLNFLVSQVFKKFNGKANPVMVKEIMLRLCKKTPLEN